MKKSLPQKILFAIDGNRLKLILGKRYWYRYILDIQELIWSRNLMEGYVIHVYDSAERYLETITLESQVVCELGCVHNRLFIYN